MKIEGSRGVSSATGAKRASPGAASGFTPALDETHQVAGAAPVREVTPLDALLALQGEDGPAQRRARQLRRGKDALDALDTLARGLVFGRAPIGLKHELETLCAASELTADAGLDAVLREIDIRLAVEAAKWERLAARA